jgi:Domain of unknown function (DUF3943)
VDTTRAVHAADDCRFRPRVECLSRGVLATLLLVCAGYSKAHAQALPADYNTPDPRRGLAQYGRGAANLALTNWAVWQIAWSRDRDWAPVTRATLEDNLRAGFEFDQDVLQTNFFGHPYHGGMQFNAARSAGLSFWESAVYTLAGSVSWELFAEREKPAINDLAVTVLGGIMLGEITYRLSSEILAEDASEGRLVRELGAAAVNPVRGLDRLTTGRAWRAGPPALRYPLRVALELGLDRVRLQHEEDDPDGGRVALLFAADVDYGDLWPREGRNYFRPFEYFELYAATNLFNRELSGAHVYSTALLYGLNLPLSRQPRALRDNDVLGLGMSYEYVGTNFTTYSGLGFGPVNHLMLRLGKQRSVRLSVGADLVPVLGATSTEAGDNERDYNFASGVSAWTGIELRLGWLGELGLQTRHYVAKVVNGQRGEEFIGSLRAWYEVQLLERLGLGFAATTVYRRGHYVARESYWAQQLSAQLYVTVEQ